MPSRLVPLHLAALCASLLAGALLILPFWPWIVLALWTSGLATGLLGPFVRLVRGRRRAAVLLTLALVLAFLLPLVLTVVPLTLDAINLVRHMAVAGDARRMLEALVSAPSTGDGSVDTSLPTLTRLVSGHGARAWDVLRTVAGATTHVLAGIAVFVIVAYGRLSNGPASYAWIERHTPVNPRHLGRLAATFSETGRGLFIGFGGAGLAQSAIAAVTYAILGVPHAIVLGLLTFFSAMIPGIGTGLVWMPVAAGLALTGRPTAALVVAVVGIALIGTIDNVLKPILARYGHLDLPASVVFVSMLGAFFIVGPKGLLLGPIVVRLAKELVVMAREEREAHASEVAAIALATQPEHEDP